MRINKSFNWGIVFVIIFCLFQFFIISAKEIKNLEATLEKANNGFSSSQSDLVDYYYNVKKDYEQAINWSKRIIDNSKSTDSEKEFSYIILGLCSQDGKGMSKSIEDAICYFIQGVNLKGANSAYCLARLYDTQRKDSTEALKWYIKSAELGNKTAALFLAKLYENGYINSNGNKIQYPKVTQDLSQAVKYYEVYVKDMGVHWGATILDAKLLYKLANCYFFGAEGLEVNYIKAFGHYNAAISITDNNESKYILSEEEMGNALWNMSVCYRFGRGVEKDELKARRYVKRAAELGNQNAVLLLNNQ